MKKLTNSALSDKNRDFLSKSFVFDFGSKIQSAVQIKHWIMTSTGSLKIVNVESNKFAEEIIRILPKINLRKRNICR